MSLSSHGSFLETNGRLERWGLWVWLEKLQRGRVNFAGFSPFHLLQGDPILVHVFEPEPFLNSEEMGNQPRGMVIYWFPRKHENLGSNSYSLMGTFCTSLRQSKTHIDRS